MGQTGLLKQITSNKQSVFGLLAAAIMVFSTFYAAIASAAPLTLMSITPSSASITAEALSVSYELTFTPDQNAGAVVIDFCDNTPLLGQSCNAPAGMDVDGAAAGSGGHTINAATDANTIVATKAGITAGTPETLVFTGLTNPTTEDTIYARIVTFTDGTDAAGYTDVNPEVVGDVIDNGSVSMYFNTTVAVSGTVLETMTFCVSGSVINPNCADLTAAAIALGEGSPKALIPGTVSTGTLHTQMNTNASGGAVVRLKSSATCGGLMRIGSTVCDIAAAGATNVVNNDNSAKFGVKLAAATSAPGALNPIGTLVPYDADGEDAGLAFYDVTNYKFNFVDGTTGVTGVFGDPLLYTEGGPATGQNMALEFAASIGTDTPAGTYSTDLSLIAVGTF